MPGDANWTTRVDSTLKAQAEDVLNELGMTMSGVFTMLLKQIVREQSVPLSLTLDSSNALYMWICWKRRPPVSTDMKAARPVMY